MIALCAIAGMIGSTVEKELMEAMLRSMAHRGPDGSGSYIGEKAALLHSRLAIIDPAGGAQPMSLSRDGERYVLVYNGELYNTEELRAELVSLGHEFQTRSDTEVLLHAYVAFGEDCVRKLNGIYAFAVWEENRKRLFLCRDRIGVKPLFYTCRGGAPGTGCRRCRAADPSRTGTASGQRCFRGNTGSGAGLLRIL